MLVDNLFDEVLVKPVVIGADKLYVVSGYASPAIVYKHLHYNPNFTVDLIIGMANKDGIRIGSHRTFQKLANEDFPGRFSCKYSTVDIPIHMKIYGWFTGAAPKQGFVGSANYSQMAFSKKQMEVMQECDAPPIKILYDQIVKNSIDCLDPLVTDKIFFYDERKIITKRILPGGKSKTIEEYDGTDFKKDGTNQFVIISLLTGGGEVGTRSGLNWGQRPGRDHNQAYIPVPKAIRDSGFFPEISQHFIILTDDDKSLDCVIAQQFGKAIHTYKSNSILGKYFRDRLGLPSGKYVEKSDYQKYGRSDVTVYKIDGETYYLDFSVNKH